MTTKQSPASPEEVAAAFMARVVALDWAKHGEAEKALAVLITERERMALERAADLCFEMAKDHERYHARNPHGKGIAKANAVHACVDAIRALKDQP